LQTAGGLRACHPGLFQSVPCRWSTGSSSSRASKAAS
jgi:hypothetical protein